MGRNFFPPLSLYTLSGRFGISCVVAMKKLDFFNKRIIKRRDDLPKTLN